MRNEKLKKNLACRAGLQLSSLTWYERWYHVMSYENIRTGSQASFIPIWLDPCWGFFQEPLSDGIGFFYYFFAFLFHICRLKNPENNRNELWIAVQSSSTSRDRCFAGFQNDMNYLDGGNDEIRSEWPEDSEGSSWSEAKMARNPEKSSKNPMIMWRTARKEDGAAQIQQ